MEPLDKQPLTIAGKFFRALCSLHTYNPAANTYATFGLLWGLPVPVMGLAVDLYVRGAPASTDAVLHALEIHAFHYALFLHPLLFMIIFGALGTIQKWDDERIR